MQNEERRDERADRRDRRRYEGWRESQEEAGKAPKAHVRSKPKELRAPPSAVRAVLPAHVAEGPPDKAVAAKKRGIAVARARGKRRPKSAVMWPR